MYKQIFSAAAVTLAVASPALAERFTPASFQAEINSRSWSKAGQQVTFSYLDSCKENFSNTYAPTDPQRLAELEAELEEANAALVHAAKMAARGLETNVWDSRIPQSYYDHWFGERRKYERITRRLKKDIVRVKLNTRVTQRKPISYSCSDGYVTTTDPRGTEVCKLGEVKIKYSDDRAGFKTNDKDCTWR